MQRYGLFGLIPNNRPDYCLSCCDKGMFLRQSGGMGLICVVDGSVKTSAGGHKKRKPLDSRPTASISLN